MGSPEKPIDVEMGDIDETNKLNPQVDIKGDEKDDKPAEVRFTGLKKEELLEISSQKNWVVARWILFIVFWAGWVGMLVGAIIIVVMAPRCKAEPTPPWYQDTVVYQAEVKKFAGDLAEMKDHVDYVRSLSSRTLIIGPVNDPVDPMKVIDDKTDDLKALIESCHSDDKEDDMKLVIGLRIDALSTSSPQFLLSSVKDCAGSRQDACAMFNWVANGSVPSEPDAKITWIYHPGRGEHFKATTSDGFAFVDYATQAATDYVKELVKTWVGHGVDGFKIRDLARITDPMSAVNAFQSAINDTESAVTEEEKKKVVGLFLVSSDVANQGSLFPAGNDTDAAAVMINTALSGVEAASGAGQQMQDIISKWRNETEPFIGAYAVNTVNLAPLAARLTPEQAAGLSLLSYALPGVPVLRSGDEALLTDDTFTWNMTTKPHTPNNASQENIAILKEMADSRVNQHRALRSLRWDNEDAVFKFRKTNSTDVLAFTRKWDTKPTILVISNPSNSNVTIKITDAVEEETGSKVLYASDSTIEAKAEYGMDGIALPSGLTLVLELTVKK